MTTGDRASGAPGSEWGPRVSGGPRRRRRRWLIVAGALVLLPVLVAVGVLVHGSRQITRVPVQGLQAGTGPLHVLVVGSDSREGLTPQQRRELSTGSAAGERTDTIFLMVVDGGRVGLLALPRDLHVTRCDGSTGRINAAQAIGGPGCLVETVTDVTGIPVDHYVTVSFLGFRGVVDALDGVRLCLEQPIQDPDAGIDLPAGCQILDGRQALGYVRVRKMDSDLERIKRQQRFLAALADAAVSPSVVANPLRLISMTGAMGGALTADQGLGPLTLVRLGWGARGLARGAAVTETVPVEPLGTDGAALLDLREEEARRLFRSFRDGSVLDLAGKPDPSEITVMVLNGTQIADLAATTARRLREQGYQVPDIGNASVDTSRTVIRHPPGARPAAEVLAAELAGDPRIVESRQVEAVTLILGPDQAE